MIVVLSVTRPSRRHPPAARVHGGPRSRFGSAAVCRSPPRAGTVYHLPACSACSSLRTPGDPPRVSRRSRKSRSRSPTILKKWRMTRPPWSPWRGRVLVGQQGDRPRRRLRPRKAFQFLDTGLKLSILVLQRPVVGRPISADDSSPVFDDGNVSRTGIDPDIAAFTSFRTCTGPPCAAAAATADTKSRDENGKS